MTKAEFKEAFKIANSDKDLTGVDDSTLFGCALPNFGTVYTTLDAVAKLIRWQGRLLNGNWDMEEVDSVAKIAQRKFYIIG